MNRLPAPHGRQSPALERGAAPILRLIPWWARGWFCQLRWVGLLAVTLLGGSSTVAARPPARPNVVFILADDLGWGDLGCYNRASKIPTPRLDRLAAEGLRFTDAHSPSAVCTPTRCGLLTGRYAWRTRLTNGVLWGYSRPLIEPDRLTVASLLRQHGYATACVGKWHLGLGWPTTGPAPTGVAALADAKPAEVDFSRPFSAGPHTVGFDYSYVLPGSLDMEPYVYVENGRVDGVPTNSVTGSKSQRQGGAGFWRGGPASPGFTHEGCQPKFAAKAVEFIRRQTAQRPFFLYLPLTSPHDPWVPTPEFRGRSSAGARGDFVTQVDATVGQILDALKAAGFDRNTLVFFSSDNGAHWLPDEVKRTGHAANGPWRGMKSDAWEGGHRVPLLARWPGVIRPGRTSAALVGLNDLTATVAELLGATLPAGAAEDSRSFLGPLRGSRRAARDPLVLHSIDGVFALRQGPWKLIAAPGSGGWTKGEGTGPVQLYHLRSDPSEARDRAGAEPERVQAMAATLERIRAGRP